MDTRSKKPLVFWPETRCLKQQKPQTATDTKTENRNSQLHKKYEGNDHQR